jgi:transposase
VVGSRLPSVNCECFEPVSLRHHRWVACVVGQQFERPDTLRERSPGSLSEYVLPCSLSSEALAMRRSQILLVSSRGHRPKTIASHLGCATHTVRTAIPVFEQEGLVCLTRASSRPKTVHAACTQATCDAVRAIVHQRPRTCGKPTSLWVLERAALVWYERGLTDTQVCREMALTRLGVGWQRATHGITSLDPEYHREKTRCDALIEQARQHGWEIGSLDEVWWGRLSQPNLHRGVKRTSRCTCRSVQRRRRTRTPQLWPVLECSRLPAVRCICGVSRGAR